MRCRTPRWSALVPVSIRTGDEEDRWQNRVSMLTARCRPTSPTARRVRRVTRAMAQQGHLPGAARRAADGLHGVPAAGGLRPRDAAERAAWARVATGPRQPRHLQRARPAPAAVRGRSPARALLPDVRSSSRARASTSPCRATSTGSTSASSAAPSWSRTSTTCFKRSSPRSTARRARHRSPLSCAPARHRGVTPSERSHHAVAALLAGRRKPQRRPRQPPPRSPRTPASGHLGQPGREGLSVDGERGGVRA